MHNRENNWKMFNAISASYDRVNAILSFGMDRSWRRRLAEHLPQRPGGLALLDLATGTGDQLISILENSPAIRSAVGVDMASEMLKIAMSKIESKPYKERVWLQCADALQLPLAASTFDVASFSFGIRNVANPLQSLKEIHRVLKPTGRCLILEFSLPPQPFKAVHLFYLRHILPRVGAFFSQNKSAYRYLNETIETFPYGTAFCRLMQSAGFHAIQQIPMALGAVTLYIGDKK